MFFSCGKVEQTKIKNFTKPFSIQSTDNILFYRIYAVKGEHGNKNYCTARINDEYDYLCIHNKKGSFSNQCLQYCDGETLSINTKIFFSGDIIKTKKRGIEGTSIFIHFKGDLNGKVIWVTDLDLRNIFESNKKIDIENIAASLILKGKIL